jgi:hypothetical protein
MTEAQFRALSREFRRGIVAYGCSETQLRLLLLLCDETLDSNQLEGRVDTVKWSLALSWRPRDLERRIWDELVKLMIIDFNAGQGTYQLRADMNAWWRPGAADASANDLRAGQELPLVCERPLSEAQSELSRQAVLARIDAERGDQPDSPTPAGSQPNHPKDWGSEWKRLQAALATGTVEQEFGPEEGAQVARGGATKVSRGCDKSVAGVRQKRKEPPGGQLQLHRGIYACNASIEDHALIPRQKCRAPDPEQSAQAWAWLRSIDVHDSLSMKNNRWRWSLLCREDPGYVLGLSGALEAGIERAKRYGKRMANPLGYLATKARGDGKLK